MTAKGHSAGRGFLRYAGGITKHTGGLEATRELLALCHVQDAHEVLDGGCGIGAGPAYIAKTFGCRVVGVDLAQRMIGWARRRARQERVEGLVGAAHRRRAGAAFPRRRVRRSSSASPCSPSWRT